MSVLLGVIVGLVLGLTGAGGSILAVPLLMWGLDWPITQAATVSLLAVTAAAALGTGQAWRHAYVRYRAATLMAGAAMLTAPIGIRLADALPPARVALVFAGVLFVVAARMLNAARTAAPDAYVLRARVAGDGAPARGKICALGADGRLVWSRPGIAVIAAIGAATGFLSGLLGVGGGFVIVPALRAATPLSMHSAVATSLMAISLISLGTVSFGLLQGRALPLAVALPFVAGSALGMTLGRHIVPHIAGRQLQAGFAAVTALVGVGMAAHALGMV